MDPAAKPPYLERGGLQSWPPPYALKGVRFYAFLLEADYGALERYVDRILNGPAGGAVTYKPLMGRVLLGLMEADRVQVGPLDCPKYSIPERDLAFWIPVACVERERGVEVIKRVAFYLTYLMVDDGWAVTSGRENYGYPKEFARFIEERTGGSGPKAPGFLTHLESHTLAVREFGPDALAEIQKLIEIRRSDGAPENPVERELDGLEELAKEFYGLITAGGHIDLPGLGLIAEVFDLIEHHEYPLVFLKEFRDVADPTRACYQSVIESPVHITAFRTAGRLDGKYEISIEPYGSHPIVDDLGLTGLQPPVLAAGYMDFDFLVDTGREIRPV